MSMGGIVGPCWGIFRELAHSPGRETDDALILKETARRLSERGFSVELKTTEEIAELPASFEPPPFLFVMCERIAVLDRIAQWEALGACVVNPTEGIRNTYRDRTATLFERNRVPFPKSVLAETNASNASSLRSPSGSEDLSGLWIKRGDVHATEAADVVRAASTADARLALADFSRRGVARALLQEHVPGDLIKFYGVAAPAPEEVRSPDEASWFEWFYHRDQVLSRHPFDAARLEASARAAADALGLEVWGGDAIVGPGGDPVVIDLNAWPSFALYRDRAAAAIAARLASRFRFQASRSPARTGVTE